MKRLLIVLGIGLTLVVGLLLLTLALPVESWRTGERPRPPLALDAPAEPELPDRVWVDTDAACGEGRQTDPDDCFAILALSADSTIEVVGVSTVFGNADLDRTTAVTRWLVGEITWRGAVPPVHAGSADPLDEGGEAPRAAHRELRDALAAGPLTVVALGPLTNVAAALAGHPGLESNLTRLVAVMGRRTGHLFHPAEGADGGILFGHGPVFRDFNAEQDAGAVSRILDTRVPLTLIPYEAAREVVLGRDHLDRLEARGGAAAGVAGRARDWLTYWQAEIGRDGFYPFDLLAAAYLLEPEMLRCARVHAWTGEDEGMFDPLWSPTVLLVTQDTSEIADPIAVGRARYCPGTDPSLQARLDELLVSGSGGSASYRGR